VRLLTDSVSAWNREASRIRVTKSSTPPSPKMDWDEKFSWSSHKIARIHSFRRASAFGSGFLIDEYRVPDRKLSICCRMAMSPDLSWISSALYPVCILWDTNEKSDCFSNILHKVFPVYTVTYLVQSQNLISIPLHGNFRNCALRRCDGSSHVRNNYCLRLTLKPSTASAKDP
jgi:hypothetical protein